MKFILFEDGSRYNANKLICIRKNEVLHDHIDLIFEEEYEKSVRITNNDLTRTFGDKIAQEWFDCLIAETINEIIRQLSDENREHNILIGECRIRAIEQIEQEIKADLEDSE